MRRAAIPLFTGTQVLPSSLERKTPWFVVPAWRYRDSAVNAQTLAPESPALDFVQVAPPLVERNIPTPKSPANIVPPFSVKEETNPPNGPRVGTHCACNSEGSVRLSSVTVNVVMIEILIALLEANW